MSLYGSVSVKNLASSIHVIYMTVFKATDGYMCLCNSGQRLIHVYVRVTNFTIIIIMVSFQSSERCVCSRLHT